MAKGNIELKLKIDHYAFEKALKNALSAQISYNTDALLQVAKYILALSQQKVPVDTGALKASGFVGRTSNSYDVPRIRIGYGGFADKVNPKTGRYASTYAVIVHEDLSKVHTVGEAKYLEKAILEVLPEIESLIASFKQKGR